MEKELERDDYIYTGFFLDNPYTIPGPRHIPICHSQLWGIGKGKTSQGLKAPTRDILGDLPN